MSPERQTLQRHIEDTIDRLHGHALQIDRAGDGHRRERVKLYQQKPEHSYAYEAYETLASLKAKDQFPKADKNSRATGRKEDVLPKPIASQRNDSPRIIDDSSRFRGGEQHTVYSATVNTKLELRPEPVAPQRAEAWLLFWPVMINFHPPLRSLAQVSNAPTAVWTFARPRQRKNGGYCDDPFGVPNTFDGLLGHMQTHVEERFHVDMPDGKHKEFTEQEFESYSKQRTDISHGDLQNLKESARYKGIFLFTECPFCGGYPDDVENMRPRKDPNTPEGQVRLRQHIKRHLQDIALFRPPYREDVVQEDENSEGSNVSRGTAGLGNVEYWGENLTVCGDEECDCKDTTKSSQDFLIIRRLFRPQARLNLWIKMENTPITKSQSQIETPLEELDAMDKHWIAGMLPQPFTGIDHQRLQRAYFDLHYPSTFQWLLESPSFLPPIVMGDIQLALSLITAEYSRVFIFVVGIRETLEDAADASLLHQLETLQLKHEINLFVTSRTVPRRFREDSRVYQIAIRADDEDLRAVTKGFLQQRGLKHDLRDEADWLIQKADGMFLFVRAILDEIEDANNDYEGVLNNMIRKSSEDEELRIQKIDQLYENILSQIEEDLDQWALITRVLSWVAFSWRSLSLEELFTILKARDDSLQLASVRRYLSLSDGLLKATPNDDALCAGHFTLNQYLKLNRERWSLLNETDLISDCILYLSSVNLSSVVSGCCTTWEDYKARVTRFPFYQCAAANWGYHRPEGPLGPAPSSLISEFLRSQVLCESSSQSLILSRHPDYYQAGAGLTGLHLAAIFGLYQEAHILLEDTYANTRDSNGTTPLAYAVGLGTMKMVNTLLINKAYPEAADRWGRTPLHIAAYLGHEPALKMFLISGANIEAKYKAQDVDSEVNAGAIWTPLLTACVGGHEPAVSVLHDNEADIHATLRSTTGHPP
ncbi:ankyrin repeat protein [Colletotrichum sojae]|uniref:Ankyrin repeat protein n=1 Tax=Colletotrichum sojae TaxID=2175907 RepID=A0A8H6IWY7_9PEZI|nr:ankyrin repeat protein [Colletotrichum sojae]